MDSKKEQLERVVLPILRCIRCDGRSLRRERSRELRCDHCGQTYPIHRDIPILSLDPRAAIAYPKKAMVEHAYSAQWWS
jgi:uncharacterized protein YbaR (Trm112 family)